MNNRDLFKALGDIDDALLEECEEIPSQKKRTPYRRYVGLAAAACLCVAALFLPPLLPGDGSQKGNGAAPFNATAKEQASDVSGELHASSPADPKEEPKLHSEIGDATGALSPQSVDGSASPSSILEDIPSDFEFTLTWEDGVYQSTDLPIQPLQEAWNLLSNAEASPTEEAGPIKLSFTANGKTWFITAAEGTPNDAFLLCTKLQKIFEYHRIASHTVQ